MKKTFLIFLLFVSMAAQALEKPGAGEKKVAKMPDDSTKVMALLELAEDYRDSDIEHMYLYADRALVLASRIKFAKGINQSYLFLGNYAYYKGEYDKAFRYYTRILKYYDRLNNIRGKADVNNNIGTVFLAENNLTEALKYFEQAYQDYHILNVAEGEGRTLNNIGNVHFNREDYDIALNYYRRSLEIKVKLGDKNGEGLLLNNIGNIYGVKGDYRKALEFFFKALHLKEEAGDDHGIALALNNIGSAYTLLHDSARALQNIRRGLAIAKKIGSLDLRQDAYSILAEINYEFGNYKEAYAHYQQSVELKDSLINLETQKSIKEIEAHYTSEKKDAEHKAEVERFKLEQEKDALEHNRKNIFIYGLFGVISLVVILLIVLLRSNHAKQKTNQLLNMQKQLIETKNDQLSEKNKSITDSINYARRLQEAILPTQKRWKQHLPESFILYKPKDIVAGDFYWLETSGNQVIFAAADCTGHGVPGAMVSVICHNALNRAFREFNLTKPGMILDKTRELILSEFDKSDEELKDGMDISLCVLDINRQQLQWAGANNPLWIIHQDEFMEIKADKQPIGKYADPQPFLTHEIDLKPGTQIYLFTDGFKDQFGGERGKKFKASQMKEILTQIRELSMIEQKLYMDRIFEEWKGGFEQVDDVCLIGIKL